MRISIVLAGLACASALAGCASTGGDVKSDYRALQADCKARGGIVKAIPGASNPNDAANYTCEFRGTSPRPAGG